MTKACSDILLEPIITEKSTGLSSFSKYTFKVAKHSSKSQIKEAFKKFYPNLKVLSINTAKVAGHSRRTKFGLKKAIDGKKAIITVEGGKIDYFPEIA